MSGSRRTILLASTLVFAGILAHGLCLGITDDEAYYWVLAQTPDWGYAFHPPAVAWSIALSQALLGGIFGDASIWVVRFPAAFMVAMIFALGLSWIRQAGVASERLKHSALTLLSYAGFFGAAWMMVPDVPLFLGWTLAFVSTWKIISDPQCRFATQFDLLVLGVCLAILSKFSGALVAVSSGLALLLFAPRERRWRALVGVFCGAMLALAPILIWNVQHDWGSLAYQFKERHGGAELSWVRYLRFWLIQLVLAGPPLLYFAFRIRKRTRQPNAAEARVSQYILIWTLPAALVFCLQPAWSEFKAHWALVVWFPVALELARSHGMGESVRIARAQIGFGWTLLLVSVLLTHFPVITWMAHQMSAPESVDPRKDISNDMHGWKALKEYLEGQGKQYRDLPVVGSRYQTASRAAFALGAPQRVTLIPRDLKQRDEWPDLGVTKHWTPEGAVLIQPTLFVADNRYDAGPPFLDARCERLQKLRTERWGYVVRWIDVWKCVPAN